MESGYEAYNNLPQNPKNTANIISCLCFAYTFPLFCKGRKKILDATDFYKVLDEHKSEMLGDKLSQAWEKQLEDQLKNGKKPSLLKAISNVFGFDYAKFGFYLLCTEFFFKLTQPFMVGRLIRFYSAGGNQDIIEAYIFAAALIFSSALRVVSTHIVIHGTVHLGMKVRLALCSMIYRKALRLSKTAFVDTTAGQVVNLLSNDVGRFDLSAALSHYLWIGPVETIFTTLLMYQLIGLGAFTGVAFMLAFIPLEIYLGKMSSVLRLQIALITDERVRLMNEIIQGIQVIKMYAWEKPFAKIVEYCRIKEIKYIKKSSYIHGYILASIIFVTRVSIFISLATYALINHYIDAEIVFVITGYYNIIRITMSVFFPTEIGKTAQTYVSVKRIQKFLLCNEFKILVLNDSKIPKKDLATNFVTDNIDNDKITDKKEKIENAVDTNDIDDVISKNNTTGKAVLSEPGIDISHIKAKWNSSLHEYTLNDVSLRVRPGTLVAIIGPIGSGKSSLIQAILGELPVEKGKININGSISYASQEPWLFLGTVRQNILFGLPLDRRRYKTVIEKCALERDFELFPYGDRTIIEERGASLSGGQRARISLARAVYRKCSIYLLDDPLSAVDTHVGRHLFDKCIRDFLRKNIVILITHQLQLIHHADQIVILGHGKIRAVGSYDSLRESGLDFAKLLETDDNEEEKATASTKSIVGFGEASAYSIEQTEEENKRKEDDEGYIKGKVGFKIYKKYFMAGGGPCYISIMFIFCVLAQTFATGCDWFFSFWVSAVQSAEVTHSHFKQLKSLFYESQDILKIFSIHCNDLTKLCNPLTQKALGSTRDETNLLAIYIFLGIIIATIIISLIRGFLFFNVAMKSSTNLHNQMFIGVTRATMYFFITNPSGRILNRFSKDIGQVDEMMPVIILDCIQMILELMGIAIVLSIINPYLLLLTLLMCIIFYNMRVFYLKTSQNVRRIEAVARSPIYSHLAATLSGLSTIRCFGTQAILQREFDNYQDMHSSAFFMFIATSRALGFWVDCVCVIYIAIVTLSFFISGGNGQMVGLGLTQVLGLTGLLQYLMRQSAEQETLMTSVERVVEYETIDPEPPLESEPDKKPPPGWPANGKIKFQHLSLKYFPHEDAEYVLKSLEFEILPSEKVGIVGRTGAGKSSLINALFRLSYNEGIIEIDGRDIHNLGLHDLRSKISIIPQEPVLFSGTMRYNLDPFNEYADEKLWAVLEEVELKDTIMEMISGLQSIISEGGSNFSVGQRQLVCLARAILRDNKVLVMDEATANVDPQTDFLIQSTVRNKFKDCTVLTIAHRLHTIMDSDKVLVMDAGRVVEFGHPYILLTESKSQIFFEMVQQTGKSTSLALLKIAEKAYKSKTL